MDRSKSPLIFDLTGQNERNSNFTLFNEAFKEHTVRKIGEDNDFNNATEFNTLGYISDVNNIVSKQKARVAGTALFTDTDEDIKVSLPNNENDQNMISPQTKYSPIKKTQSSGGGVIAFCEEEGRWKKLESLPDQAQMVNLNEILESGSIISHFSQMHSEISERSTKHRNRNNKERSYNLNQSVDDGSPQTRICGEGKHLNTQSILVKEFAGVLTQASLPGNAVSAKQMIELVDLVHESTISLDDSEECAMPDQARLVEKKSLKEKRVQRSTSDIIIDLTDLENQTPNDNQKNPRVLKTVQEVMHSNKELEFIDLTDSENESKNKHQSGLFKLRLVEDNNSKPSVSDVIDPTKSENEKKSPKIQKENAVSNVVKSKKTTVLSNVIDLTDSWLENPKEDESSFEIATDNEVLKNTTDDEVLKNTASSMIESKNKTKISQVIDLTDSFIENAQDNRSKLDNIAPAQKEVPRNIVPSIIDQNYKTAISDIIDLTDSMIESTDEDQGRFEYTVIAQTEVPKEIASDTFDIVDSKKEGKKQDAITHGEQKIAKEEKGKPTFSQIIDLNDSKNQGYEGMLDDDVMEDETIRTIISEIIEIADSEYECHKISNSENDSCKQDRKTFNEQILEEVTSIFSSASDITEGTDSEKREQRKQIKSRKIELSYQEKLSNRQYQDFHVQSPSMVEIEQSAISKSMTEYTQSGNDLSVIILTDCETDSCNKFSVSERGYHGQSEDNASVQSEDSSIDHDGRAMTHILGQSTENASNQSDGSNYSEDRRVHVHINENKEAVEVSAKQEIELVERNSMKEDKAQNINHFDEADSIINTDDGSFIGGITAKHLKGKHIGMESLENEIMKMPLREFMNLSEFEKTFFHSDDSAKKRSQIISSQGQLNKEIATISSQDDGSVEVEIEGDNVLKVQNLNDIIDLVDYESSKTWTSDARYNEFIYPPRDEIINTTETDFDNGHRHGLDGYEEHGFKENTIDLTNSEYDALYNSIPQVESSPTGLIMEKKTGYQKLLEDKFRFSHLTDSETEIIDLTDSENEVDHSGLVRHHRKPRDKWQHGTPNLSANEINEKRLMRQRHIGRKSQTDLEKHQVYGKAKMVSEVISDILPMTSTESMSSSSTPELQCYRFRIESTNQQIISNGTISESGTLDFSNFDGESIIIGESETETESGTYTVSGSERDTKGACRNRSKKEVESEIGDDSTCGTLTSNDKASKDDKSIPIQDYAKALSIQNEHQELLSNKLKWQFVKMSSLETKIRILQTKQNKICSKQNALATFIRDDLDQDEGLKWISIDLSAFKKLQARCSKLESQIMFNEINVQHIGMDVFALINEAPHSIRSVSANIVHRITNRRKSSNKSYAHEIDESDSSSDEWHVKAAPSRTGKKRCPLSSITFSKDTVDGSNTSSKRDRRVTFSKVTQVRSQDEFEFGTTYDRNGKDVFGERSRHYNDRKKFKPLHMLRAKALSNGDPTTQPLLDLASSSVDSASFMGSCSSVRSCDLAQQQNTKAEETTQRFNCPAVALPGGIVHLTDSSTVSRLTGSHRSLLDFSELGSSSKSESDGTCLSDSDNSNMAVVYEVQSNDTDNILHKKAYTLEDDRLVCFEPGMLLYCVQPATICGDANKDCAVVGSANGQQRNNMVDRKHHYEYGQHCNVRIVERDVPIMFEDELQLIDKLSY